MTISKYFMGLFFRVGGAALYGVGVYGGGTGYGGAAGYCAAGGGKYGGGNGVYGGCAPPAFSEMPHFGQNLACSGRDEPHLKQNI